MKIFYCSKSRFFWFFCYLVIHVSKADEEPSQIPAKPSPKDFMRLNARINHVMEVLEQIQQQGIPTLDNKQTEYDQLEKLIKENVEQTAENRNFIQHLNETVIQFSFSNKDQNLRVWEEMREVKALITKLSQSMEETVKKAHSDLDCGDTCFRLSNTLYTMYPYVAVTWDQAKAKCASQGMSMAMVKDNTTHQFLRQKLKAYYADRPNKQDAFWVGLRRLNLGTQWRWADGSWLAGYQGWAFTPYHNDLCVNIANTKRFDFNWDADHCDSATGSWTYYALCQKDLGPQP